MPCLEKHSTRWPREFYNGAQDTIGCWVTLQVRSRSLRQATSADSAWNVTLGLALSCCGEGLLRMASVFWALFAVVLGSVLVYRFGNLTVLKPRWASRLLIFGVGTAVGIGLTSCSFFLLHLLAPSLPSLPMWVETVLLGWATYDVLRTSRQKATRSEEHTSELQSL